MNSGDQKSGDQKSVLKSGDQKSGDQKSANRSQNRERKGEGEEGEGKRKGGERRKEMTGVWGRQRPDRVRKHPGHTEKKKSDRLGLNFYPSHFLPKKCYNNNLPKFTQGFD